MLRASNPIESWENTHIEGIDHQLGGPWHISGNLLEGVSVSFSRQHATDGEYSLEIKNRGVWSQVIQYGENSDDPVNGMPLSAFLADKMTLELDVFTDEKLDWAKVDIAVQGDALPWTQLSLNILQPGQTHVRYLIPPKTSSAIKNCKKWFQLIIAVNTSGPGSVYIDNLSAE